MADNSEQIAANALKPKKARSDNLSGEQHDIEDQIAADRYAKNGDQVAQSHGGLRYRKMINRGAGF